MTNRHGGERRRQVSWLFLLMLAAASVFINPGAVAALSSQNYQIQEDFMGGATSGSGGGSSSYKLGQEASGAPASGDGASGGSRTRSGPSTTDDPELSFSVNSSSVNLGSLSTSLTRTGTATFSVSNYTSYGYLVQVLGAPPSNGQTTLSGMSSPGSSQTGTEQFGINLRANTSPSGFGADPQQQPDNSFSFGAGETGYNAVNQYKYISGDTIASAPKSSGKTDYTISYIANMGFNTQGGSYSGQQTLIVVGTY